MLAGTVNYEHLEMILLFYSVGYIGGLKVRC